MRFNAVDGHWRETYPAEQRPPLYQPTDYAFHLQQLAGSSFTNYYLKRNGSQSSKLSRRSSDTTLHSAEDRNVSELLKRLKTDLKFSYVSFVKEFISAPQNGISLLLDVLKQIQLSQTDCSLDCRLGTKQQHLCLVRTLADEHETLMCLRYCLRVEQAGAMLASHGSGLYALAVCLMSNVNKSRILAAELLAKACEASCLGHSQVLEAISTLRLRFGEPIRFKFIIGMINSFSSAQFQVACFRLLNAILETSGDPKERAYLQAEMEEAGFNETELKKALTPSHAEYEAMVTELDRWQRNYIDVERILTEFQDLKSKLGELQDRVNRAEEARKMAERERDVLLSRSKRRSASASPSLSTGSRDADITGSKDGSDQGIHSDGIKSGTSFGTEEEDDGHLSDFEGSGGGADSDADGTLRHGTYVVQPYNNSTSDRSTNYARPNKHRSVDRSVDSPTSSSPSERALRRRRGMDLPPSPPSRRGGPAPASSGGKSRKNSRHGDEREEISADPQLSIRAPTRSSSQDDAMSVTVEDVMEDFRSILRTQQQQLDLQEGSQMPPRSASRESRNHGLNHRSPSPRVKNGHVSPEKSMSNGPSKARTSSSSSSSSGFMNHDNRRTPKAGSRNRQQLPTAAPPPYIFPPPHRSPNHQPTQDYETSDTESALSPTDVTSLQTVDSESNKSFGFVRPVSVDEGSGPHSLSFLRHLGIGSSSIESGSTKSFGFFRPQSSPTNHPSPQPHSLATPRRTEANGDGVRRSESLQFRGGVAPSSLVYDPKRSSKEKSKKHRNKEKSSSSSSLVGAYPPQSPRGPQVIGRGPPSFPRPPDWTLEWKYQPVVDKNSGLINPGTFIAKPKHFFGATNRDFRARVQAARSMEGLDRLPIFLPWGPSPMTKEVPVRNIPTPDYSTATSTTSSVRTVIRNGTIHRGPHLLDMPAGLY